MIVPGDGDRAPSISNSHQVVELELYSEPVHSFLDLGAIPSVISDK